MERTVAGARVLRQGFLAAPDVVREGRLIVESQALQWGLGEETVQVAVLITSELLTNAVEAAPGSSVVLRMGLVGNGLQVEVWDSSPERPRRSSPELFEGDSDPGGWGLGIVDALSEAWGVRDEFDGKSVWALVKGSVGGAF